MIREPDNDEVLFRKAAIDHRFTRAEADLLIIHSNFVRLASLVGYSRRNGSLGNLLSAKRFGVVRLQFRS
jgi:hypothetical protein